MIKQSLRVEDLNGGAHGVEAAQLHLLLAVRVPRLLVEPEVEPSWGLGCKVCVSSLNLKFLVRVEGVRSASPR